MVEARREHGGSESVPRDIALTVRRSRRRNAARTKNGMNWNA